MRCQPIDRRCLHLRDESSQTTALALVADELTVASLWHVVEAHRVHGIERRLVSVNVTGSDSRLDGKHHVGRGLGRSVERRFLLVVGRPLLLVKANRLLSCQGASVRHGVCAGR